MPRLSAQLHARPWLLLATGLLFAFTLTAVDSCLTDEYTGSDGLCSNTCRYDDDGDCDDGGPGSDYSLCSYGTDCGDCGARDPLGEDDDDDDDGPGGCGDYSSEYGTGDEQMDLICQAVWAYRCAGDDQAADASCQVIRDYAGTDAPCPYCD